jgi:hypothetical protein
VFEQRLGDADHHLRVVGVVQGAAAQVPDDLLGRAEGPVDVVGRQALVRGTQGIADGLAQQAAEETLDRNDG